MVDEEHVFKWNMTKKEVDEDGNYTFVYTYETSHPDCEAIFTLEESQRYKEVEGVILVEDSKYEIDNCGEGCHVLTKLGKRLLNPRPDIIREEATIDNAMPQVTTRRIF